MKYLVALGVGAVLIGGLLSAAVFLLWGHDVGLFLAEFVAAPVGIGLSLVLFVTFDTIWPKDKEH